MINISRQIGSKREKEKDVVRRRVRVRSKLEGPENIKW